MEGRAPASPFAPSSPKRPSLWRRRAPPSTDHASQWRGDLCEPIAPSQLKAPKFGRRSSLARRRRRHGGRRSLDTLARAVLLERPDPHFQTGTANQFKARRIFFSSSSIVAFMVNARDEGVASTKEARAEEGPCVLPLERLHFNPTPVSRADDSARIKFVWTAIMLISPPRIDTDETRIAESQNFLTL